MLNIRIHGDNIVECERAWGFLKSALFGSKTIKCKPFGSAVSPKYEIKRRFKVQFFPGFGRWNPNILDYIKERGALLRETPDAIICILVKDNSGKEMEMPVLAIEFCGALHAGNQAWQRCGRGYSFAKAGIPYLYITDIGSYELDLKRREKAMRLPNPVVPFAYITLNLNSLVPSLPIFLRSTTAKPVDIKIFTACFGKEEITTFIKHVIYQKDLSNVVDSIVSKTLKFVNALSHTRKRADTYRKPTWEEWYSCIKAGEDAIEFICNEGMVWSKTAYIKNLTNKAKKVIREASKYAVAVGASQVPICLIPRSKRMGFAKMIMKQYSDLTKEFKQWLCKDSALGICWITGFKPGGEDSRPDRGLPPLARMLLGPHIDLMSFVYGPAKKNMWKLMRDNPAELTKNGLWESILALSDAVLIDSSTDRGVTKKGYIRKHWRSLLSKPISRPIPVINQWPIAIGENDVDTVIHLLLYSENNRNIFEGMCNPPGGDWSGISIIDIGKAPVELRWISLPRVSVKGSKRPDHVFQFFTKNSKPVILAIESKEKANDIKAGIGNRLVKYIYKLLNSPASAEKGIRSNVWKRSSRSIKLSDYHFVSAAAFLINDTSDMINVKDKAKVDLIFGISLKEEDMSAKVSLMATSPIGKKIIHIIKYSPSIKSLPLSIDII